MEKFHDEIVPSHLRILHEASIRELPINQHVKVAGRLVEYQNVFSGGDGDLGKTEVIKHRINCQGGKKNKRHQLSSTK